MEPPTPDNSSSYAGALKPGPENLPAIAVLQFCTADDRILPRYFADGFASQIIGSMARIPDLRVISASSSLRYRATEVDRSRAARELSVDFLLDGEILRQDQQLTFRYRLLDARQHTLMWADQVQANLDDLFEIERDVVSRVVNGIIPHIRDAEIARALQKPPESLTAYDLVLRALPDLEIMEPARHEAASQLLGRAMLLDPSYPTAFAWAARLHSIRIGQGWSRNRQADADEALGLAATATRLDPSNSLALATAAHLDAYLHRRYDEALVRFREAIKSCHNDTLAWSLSSGTLSYCGRGSEARERAELALRLSPFDRSVFQLYFYAALASYVEGDFTKAEHWGRRALAENPRFTSSHKVLAVSLVGQGRINDAREIARHLQRLEPGFFEAGRSNAPFRERQQRDLYLKHLHTAGAIDIPVTVSRP